MKAIIDRESHKKLYLQLYEIMKVKMESGEWEVDSQIPTEDDLCRLFDVSKATVRLAVSELSRQGYLKRQQGKGTFVCKRIIPEELSMVTSFRELMLEAGVQFTTKVLAQTVMMPTEDLALNLDVPEDKHLIYIKRLRLVNSEPVLLQETFIPRHICPQLLEENLETTSLQEIIQDHCGIPITRVQDYISIASLTRTECELLGLSSECVALMLEQLLFSRAAQISYTRSLKHPERFKFFIELERTPR
jgi:GntR family transcriptional regulator